MVIETLIYLHMYSFSHILIGILEGEKMNVLLKRIMLQLIHLVFFSRIVDMWNTIALLVRQATTIASFYKVIPRSITCDNYQEGTT